MSFDEMWGQARTSAAARQHSSMQLNHVPASGGSGGDGASDYTVTSPDLKAVGNEAQGLFHRLDTDAFHAGAQTGTAVDELMQDGFATGLALSMAWNKWVSQAEALLSACGHIHNHLEDTVMTHESHEEILVTNVSVEKLSKDFK